MSRDVLGVATGLAVLITGVIAVVNLIGPADGPSAENLPLQSPWSLQPSQSQRRHPSKGCPASVLLSCGSCNGAEMPVRPVRGTWLRCLRRSPLFSSNTGHPSWCRQSLGICNESVRHSETGTDPGLDRSRPRLGNPVTIAGLEPANAEATSPTVTTPSTSPVATASQIAAMPNLPVQGLVILRYQPSVDSTPEVRTVYVQQKGSQAPGGAPAQPASAPEPRSSGS